MTITTDQSDPTLGRDLARVYPAVLEVRDVGTVGKNPYRYLEGRAVPFDTWTNTGLFMESHAAGSLRQTTSVGAGRTLPLLMFHDHQSFPIGRADSWDNTPEGLDGVWKLNDSPEAQRAAAAAERGELTGLSIGFMPIRSAWDMVGWDAWDPDMGPDHMDKVTRLESRLVEVSLTPTPAYTDAQVAQVRAAGVQIRSALLGDRPHAEVDRWRDIVDGLRSR